MVLLFVVIIVAIIVVKFIRERKYKELESEVLIKLGFSSWNVIAYFDECVTVKSRQKLEKYDDILFLRKMGNNLYEQRVLLKENRK